MIRAVLGIAVGMVIAVAASIALVAVLLAGSLA